MFFLKLPKKMMLIPPSIVRKFSIQLTCEVHVLINILRDFVRDGLPTIALNLLLHIIKSMEQREKYLSHSALTGIILACNHGNTVKLDISFSNCSKVLDLESHFVPSLLAMLICLSLSFAL